MKPLLCIGLFVIVNLTACQSDGKNPIPYYLLPDSALDAPGAAAQRKQIKAQRAKEGRFTEGDSVDVSSGQAFFFATNPELDGGQKGKLMKVHQVKIITCEGLYYYVQTPDGDGGYLRETDLLGHQGESPTALLGPFPEPADGTWFGQGTSLAEPLDGAMLGAEGLFPYGREAQLMTNKSGRTVAVKSKLSEQGQEFRALNELEIPDLPTPASEKKE